jgi:hypothetical protein
MRHNSDNIINDKQYRHILTLSYNEIVPFVFRYLKKYTFPVLLYLILLSLSFIWFIISWISLDSDYSTLLIGTHMLAGLVIIPLLLVIPHELLHIVPYYISGARKIRIGAEWKQYYFYVTADKFPVSSTVFICVALTPYIIITTIFIILGLFSLPLWQMTFIASLFVHMTMCAGDLALINFYYINREKNIITWDDVEKKEAYFYETLASPEQS